MSLVITNTYTSGSTITAEDVNDNFTDVVNKFGNIDNSDIKSGAAIDVDKLSAQYQEVHVTLVVLASDLASGWPASGSTTPLALCPIPGSNGDTAWEATDVSWACDDTGGGTGTFDVRLGEYSSGSWSNTTSVVTGATISNGGAANDGNNIKALEGGSVSLAFSTGARSLAIMSAGSDATTLTATGSRLAVTVALRRKITS